MATKRHTHQSHHEREEQEPQQEPVAPAPTTLDIDYSTIRNAHEDSTAAPSTAPLGEVADYSASPGHLSVSVKQNEHEDLPEDQTPRMVDEEILDGSNEPNVPPPSVLGTSQDPTEESAPKEV